jgi:hypothetical protein
MSGGQPCSQRRKLFPSSETPSVMNVELKVRGGPGWRLRERLRDGLRGEEKVTKPPVSGVGLRAFGCAQTSRRFTLACHPVEVESVT